MGHIIAIGEEHRTRGFGLVGCEVLPASNAAEVRRAWASLPGEVDLVLLTPMAAQALADEMEASDVPLVAVMQS